MISKLFFCICFAFFAVFSLNSENVISNSDDGVNFLVMADWGGEPDSPYYTVDEKDSAQIMSEVATQYNISLVFGIGDNFYDSGVTNEFDPRFQETFEDIFSQESLKNIPFYFVAGNHDHLGNVTGEIHYSNHSSRWHFDNFYYTYTFNVSSKTSVKVILIDTVLLGGIVFDKEYCDKYNIPSDQCNLVPENYNANISQKEWDWITNELIESNNKYNYIFVAGHYPIWSIAEHGPTPILVAKLRPLLIEYNVNGYICGHDHTFEYFIEDDYPNLAYIDTGGTHTCDGSTSHEKDVPKNSLKFHYCNYGGFVRFHITDSSYQVIYYDGTGNVTYTTAPLPPRF